MDLDLGPHSGTLRWLVTGAGGQLGADLVRVLESGDPDGSVTGLDRSDLDVTDGAAVEAVIGAHRPDLVVNAAGYTAVDTAETDEEAAYAVNAMAPANLARACSAQGVRLIHVSTDYVFPGDATAPYEVDAPTGPRSAYGRTKLAGERAVRELCPESYVVRTAWLYGAHGSNFVRTIARLVTERDHLDVVDDQRGSPTWSHDLARGLVALGASSVNGGAAYGTYHCVNGGETSWYGLARAVCEEMGVAPALVRPTTSTASARAAARPSYSVLSTASWSAAGLPPPRHWRDALREAFEHVGPSLTAR